MRDYIERIIRLLWEKVALISHLDLSRVEFMNYRWGVGVGILLIVACAAKILYSRLQRPKVARGQSGHPVTRAYARRPWSRVMHGIPKIFFVLAALCGAITVARPYMLNHYEVKVEESTEICYLQDASGSMTDIFQGSDKSKAEIAHDALLDLIQLRQGKKDRACFWLFSTRPYKITGFTTDERAFMFQVYNAPWVFDGGRYSYIPPDKLILRSGEGGTEMDVALQAMAKYFNQNKSEAVRDERGNLRVPRRALVVITDAEVYQRPDKGFKDLKDETVVPYVIHLHGTARPLSEAGQQFLDDIPTYGGKIFLIENDGNIEDALRSAVREINTIEKTRTWTKQYTERVELFQVSLALGMVFLVLALALGSIMEPSGRYP